MKLTFLGAAGEVTGSCHMVEAAGQRFLLDCGMFQGHFARQKNFARFRFDPRKIDFVVLSHAHIDHSGLLPRLVAEGFTGPIYATPATCDLLAVMLPDSAYLQEREAETHGMNAPLYSVEQAAASLRHLSPVDYGVSAEPANGVRFVFHDAGHILGSAIVEIAFVEGTRRRTLVYSGDLGQPGRPIVRDPAQVAAADVLLVESTYGDRRHKNLAQSLDEFAFAITDTLASRGGNVVIPAFAVGRTQDILYFLFELHAQRRLPDLDVYVDSPLALAATRITLKHADVYDRESGAFRQWLVEGKERPGLRMHFTESVEESMRINAIRSGAVILSASGMCEGGRIRHHLRYNVARPECSVIFAGFQAAGTLGRSIVDGSPSIRLFGESYPVRARIFTIGGMSAHADHEALLDWLGGFSRRPGKTWIVHGESLSAHALRDELTRRGWEAEVAAAHKEIEIA